MTEHVPAPRNAKVSADALTKREQAFVSAVVGSSIEDSLRPTEAALRAGLSPSNSRGAAAVRANEMMKKPRVVNAIREGVMARIKDSAAEAFDRLWDLARSAQSEQVRLSALKEILDRSIGPIASRNAVSIHAKHEHLFGGQSPEDLILAAHRRIEEREAKERHDRAEVIDAEVTEVSPVD